MDSLSPTQKLKIEECHRIGLERRAALQTTSACRDISAGLVSRPANVPVVQLNYDKEKNRFVVQVGYNRILITFFRSMSNWWYNPESRSWDFPLCIYEEFMKKAETVSDVCVFGPLSSSVFEPDLSSIDPVLLNKLFEFQKFGIRFGINRSGRVLIADDMGLGKTLQALGIAHYYVKDWPLLIVCPSSMKFQWRGEIYNNLPSVPEISTVVINTYKDDFEGASIIIMSYGLLSKLENKIISYKFGAIILDESHAIKSHKAQRTRAALEIIRSKSVKRVILLSGTPALSRPIELYTQIKAVSPFLFPSRIEFGQKFCAAYNDDDMLNCYGASNTEELKKILYDSIMVRRTKSEVLGQLPPKMRYIVLLDRERVDHDNESLNEYGRNFRNKELPWGERCQNLFHYYTETGRAKIPAVCKYVEQILEDTKEQGEKFLVFGYHRDVLNSICKILNKKDVRYIRIDGSVSSEDRKEACDNFQQDKDCRVAVLSIKSASTGITLTAANFVIFAELFWNPGTLLQAEDRAHRIGQRDSVTVQYLLANDTADDYLWSKLQDKLSVLNRVGLSEEYRMDAEYRKDLVYLDDELEEDESYDFSSVVSRCLSDQSTSGDDSQSDSETSGSCYASDRSWESCCSSQSDNSKDEWSKNTESKKRRRILVPDSDSSETLTCNPEPLNDNHLDPLSDHSQELGKDRNLNSHPKDVLESPQESGTNCGDKMKVYNVKTDSNVCDKRNEGIVEDGSLQEAHCSYKDLRKCRGVESSENSSVRAKRKKRYPLDSGSDKERNRNKFSDKTIRECDRFGVTDFIVDGLKQKPLRKKKMVKRKRPQDFRSDSESSEDGSKRRVKRKKPTTRQKKSSFIKQVGNEDTDREKSEFVDSEDSLGSFIVDDDQIESSQYSSRESSDSDLTAPQNLNSRSSSNQDVTVIDESSAESEYKSDTDEPNLKNLDNEVFQNIYLSEEKKTRKAVENRLILEKKMYHRHISNASFNDGIQKAKKRLFVAESDSSGSEGNRP